jgi:hypothetical protein
MMTEVLRRSLSAIPDYDLLSDAIEAVESHVATLPIPQTDPAAAIAAEVRDAVVAGKPVPDNIGARIVAADDAARARRAEARLIGVRAGPRGHGIVGRLMAERDQLVRSHADDALGFLADQLTDVLDAVREADQALGGIRTVEQALAATAEQGAAWRVLAEQVRRYGELRSAQTEILVAAGHERPRVRPDVEDGGLIRDVHTVDPRWQSRIAGEEQVPDAVLAARSAWPSPRPTRGAGHWPTSDKPGYLRWLATGPARPWVPGRRQLAAQLDRLAADEREAAARRAPSGPSVERSLVAAGIESRARFRH